MVVSRASLRPRKGKRGQCCHLDDGGVRIWECTEEELCR